MEKFFSEFWKVDVDKITDKLRLDDNSLEDQNSVRFYQFIAALESNLDITIKNVHKIVTFGDLLKSILAK